MSDPRIQQDAIKPSKGFNSILGLLQDSIDLIASEEKEAYLHATLQCPDLVEEESDPLIFLHFEDYDVWRAATRLVKYWQWRKEIFQERAFLRILDLTGFGAPDETTIKGLGTRAGAFLPNDHDGTFVWFFDRRKLGKEFYNQDQQTMLRMVFFGFQYIIDNHRSTRTDKKAALGFLNLLTSLPPWIRGKRNWPNLIKEAMPFELNNDKAWFKAILPYLQLVLRNSLDFTEVEILCFDSPVDLKDSLLTRGFREDGLPEAVGGCYSIDRNWGRVAPHGKTAICDTESLYFDGGNQLMENRAFTPKELDSKINNISNSLEKAIEAIPFGDKVSLLKVKKYASEVYEMESHQPLFHKFHSYNTHDAATHCCQHWELRNKLFAENSFLWMNQAGTGSLRKADMDVLRSGIIMILPKDLRGNFVLVYDHTKTFEHSNAPLRRCIFYILYLLMEQSSIAMNTTGHVGSIRLLFRVNSQQGFPQISTRKRFVDILRAFPLEFADFHLTIDNDLPGTVDTKIVEQALLHMYTLFEPPQDKVIIHSSKPGETIYDSLMQYGFHKTNIPEYLGGVWTQESFFLWQDEVINYEATNKTSITVRVEQKTLCFCRKDMKWKKLPKNNGRKRKKCQLEKAPPGFNTKEHAADPSDAQQAKRHKQEAPVHERDVQLSPVRTAAAGWDRISGFFLSK